MRHFQNISIKITPHPPYLPYCNISDTSIISLILYLVHTYHFSTSTSTYLYNFITTIMDPPPQITSNVLRSPQWLGWPLWNICVTNDHGYLPLVVSTSWSFPQSWLITGFVDRWTWRVPLVEQELLTLRSTWVFSEVRVTRSLVLCVCFIDRCLSFFHNSLVHCIVCSLSIYIFWLPVLVSSSRSSIPLALYIYNSSISSLP